MDPFLGMIVPFGFNFAPRGWALCNGQLMSIAQNTALFSLLGTTYGGDGRTTFGLPDLRGRSAISFGQGPGLSPYAQGQMSGLESVTLNQTQLPAHTHTLNVSATMPASSNGGDSDSPVGNILAANPAAENYAAATAATGTTAPLTVTSSLNPAGSSQPVSILSPYLVVNFCIATQGIFPSRA